MRQLRGWMEFPPRNHCARHGRAARLLLLLPRGLSAGIGIGRAVRSRLFSRRIHPLPQPYTQVYTILRLSSVSEKASIAKVVRGGVL
jgi:hypothetical protein